MPRSRTSRPPGSTRTSIPSLDFAGPPVGRGFYVMYLRKGDAALRDALDRGIARLAQTGALRRLYERYGIWTEAQEELVRSIDPETGGSADGKTRGWALIARYGFTLLQAAGVTVVLSLVSMPLAIVLGLLVALGRLYGPKPLRPILTGYVELLRGTPLMLQLYALFFLLPEMGVELPAMVAAVIGLAVNYSAYEAEIYRAGLQAVPAGQMEAALAPGDDAADGVAAGDRSAGGADRDPPGDERLHRPVQGHLGLLGDLGRRADEAVLDPGQQHGRASSSSRR